jgi:hypothetical protein
MGLAGSVLGRESNRTRNVQVRSEKGKVMEKRGRKKR